MRTHRQSCVRARQSQGHLSGCASSHLPPPSSRPHISSRRFEAEATQLNTVPLHRWHGGKRTTGWRLDMPVATTRPRGEWGWGGAPCISVPRKEMHNFQLLQPPLIDSIKPIAKKGRGLRLPSSTGLIFPQSWFLFNHQLLSFRPPTLFAHFPLLSFRTRTPSTLRRSSCFRPFAAPCFWPDLVLVHTYLLIPWISQFVCSLCGQRNVSCPADIFSVGNKVGAATIFNYLLLQSVSQTLLHFWFGYCICHAEWNIQI